MGLSNDALCPPPSVLVAGCLATEPSVGGVDVGSVSVLAFDVLSDRARDSSLGLFGLSIVHDGRHGVQLRPDAINRV